MGQRQEKVCPGCISKTVRCRKLILGRDIGGGVGGGGGGWGGCRCAMSWCDLDLTIDLVIVTMSFKILSGFISLIP